MGPTRNMVRIAVVGALAALPALVPAGTASADPAPADTGSDVRLNGRWAPFTRCPVDDPAMLAADGVRQIPLCVASDAPSGSITLGNTTAPVENSNLQFGIVGNAGSSFSAVPPRGDTIVADPVQIPGGLLGLMCPSDIPLISGICVLLTDNELNNVTATVQPAGDPSDFDFEATGTTGEPILTLPVKIHLENPLLAESCFIGSDDDPIMLRPENLTIPTGSFERFDGDGTSNPDGVMFRLNLSEGALGDDFFAVPAARGCGLFGLIDAAINLRSGLPSPAGNNSLVLDDVTTSLSGLNSPSNVAPDAGQVLSDHWHSAVLP